MQIASMLDAPVDGDQKSRNRKKKIPKVKIQIPFVNVVETSS